MRLRETEEELAIPRQEVEVLGRPDFICNQAGFLMRPVLGLVSAAGFWRWRPPLRRWERHSPSPGFFGRPLRSSMSMPCSRTCRGDFPYETVGFLRTTAGPGPGGGPHLVLAGPRRLGYDRPPDPGHRPPPGIKSTGRAGHSLRPCLFRMEDLCAQKLRVISDELSHAGPSAAGEKPNSR